MRARKTLNKDVLKEEIGVYCATMANFWNNKNDEMYNNSRQGIYTIIGLMVNYMGEEEEKLLEFARRKLNAYVLFDGNKISSDIIFREI